MRRVTLYGSYARGDFQPGSDIDIMILLDMSGLDLKVYSQQVSYMTYDFNLDNDLDIKPIAKSEDYFKKWVILCEYQQKSWFCMEQPNENILKQVT